MKRILVAVFSLVVLFGMKPFALAQNGVLVNKEEALSGYTLIAPQFNDNVYLIDNDGRVVNEWDVGSLTREAHLLDSGNVVVLRAPHEELDNSLISLGYAVEGAVAEYTWDGEMVWEYVFRDPSKRQHHGIDFMPNGNILALVWDYHHIYEAFARGLDLAIVAASFDDTAQLLPDTVLEIDKANSDIAWQWQAWDHIIQNLDESLPSFGEPSNNPQRIDINYQSYHIKGFIPNSGPEDWMHSNAVNYNPKLNQIIISVHSFDEFWIIDRNLTTNEAAGPAGDLLYRWGNPFAYGQGDRVNDRKLFQQHDAQWIEEGMPGAGNILIYNNRNNIVREDEQAEDEYSSILEMKLPLRDDGSYDWNVAPEIVWMYDQDFFSHIISGVQRLPNGNTLITEGVPGRLIEVTADGEVVWEFINPIPDRNWLFRSRKYAADHPGLAGKDLSPGPVLVAEPTESE